ncbi:putative lipid II flippase FtsW [Oscillatoria amoena NRMC-F 0135]|nr:putative lipid II flippase FtsW [Oscillatoria amoena NRMC-F 0135]
MFSTKQSAPILVVVVLLLTTLGLVMLFSTSAFAIKQSGDAYYFIERQIMFLALGGVGCVVAACFNYRNYEKFAWWILGLTIVALLLCLIPGLGIKVGGARRWLNLGFTRVQPAEFAKLGVMIFLCYWMAKNMKYVGQWNWGFLYPLAIVGVPVALIFLQPDLGTAALIGAAAIILMFIAGTKMRYILPCVIGLPALVLGIAMAIPNRRARLLSFLDPSSSPDGVNYQINQALIALGSGGIEGLGLGNSRQKMMYLPEAHTDFIFPVIGEELGLWWTLGIIFCYILILVCGFMIALRANDNFGLYLASGITLLMSLQAVINIGVVTALLPNKGMPLPFISYGGSNLLVSLIGVGILINIYRHCVFEEQHDPFAIAESTPKV